MRQNQTNQKTPGVYSEHSPDSYSSTQIIKTQRVRNSSVENFFNTLYVFSTDGSHHAPSLFHKGFQLLHSVARYVHSLTLLTLLTCSAALRFAALASPAHSVHKLAHSLRSLAHGTVKFINMCSHCKYVQWEQTRFLLSVETRPESSPQRPTTSLKVKSTIAPQLFPPRIKGIT